MGILEQQQVADERWRQEVDRRLDEHMERLDNGEARMKELTTKLDTNNAMTARVEANTAALLATFNAFRGFLEVGGWIGTFAKWVVAILLAAGLLVWAIKTGELPRKA